MTLNEAVRLMRGKVGTDITLTVAREGTTKPFKVTLKRAVIKIQSVKNKLLEPGYGYVRITQFQAGTERYLNDAVKKLNAENKGALRGLVLDLRNNPGGVLNAAVAVSDAFLNKGLIVYTEGRVADSRLKFSATPGDILNGAPIVVLVNGGSASASEIVAERVAGPQARRRHGHQDLRQGLGADDRAGVQRRRAQAHHRALLHAERSLDPGDRHRPGHRRRRSQDHQERGRRPAPGSGFGAPPRGRREPRRRRKKRRTIRRKSPVGCWPRPTITSCRKR